MFGLKCQMEIRRSAFDRVTSTLPHISIPSGPSPDIGQSSPSLPIAAATFSTGNLDPATSNTYRGDI